MAGVEYWKENLTLKACLVKYVEERMQRTEILYFMQRDYPNYKWSLRSLDRRLGYFDIKYIVMQMFVLTMPGRPFAKNLNMYLSIVVLIDLSSYYVFVALCIVVIVVSLIFKMAYLLSYNPCKNF